jgi:hypothetical protein
MLRRATCAAKGFREEMIGNQLGEALKPEVRKLREHLALARNAVGHDAVEGRDAIRGDEQKGIAQVENLADLAALELLDARQVEVQQCFMRHVAEDGFAALIFNLNSRLGPGGKENARKKPNLPSRAVVAAVSGDSGLNRRRTRISTEGLLMP